MKKILLTGVALLMAVSVVSAEEFLSPQGDGKGVIGGRKAEAWRQVITENIEFSEQSACDTPPTGHWNLCTTSAGLFIIDDQAAATQLTSGAGDNTLDNAYDQGGAGAGRTITADTGAVTINNTDADTAYLLAVTPTPGSSAATGGVQITSGANATQDSLNIVNAGTGDDIQAGNGAFKVSSTGAVTGLSVDLTGALTAAGIVTLGNGTAAAAINTSSWDISSAGAMSGFSSLTLTDDITLANGKAVKSSTTTAETMLLQAYDVDNTTYRDVLTLTNGNTIAAALGSGLETVAINSTTWDVSTLGAFTGIADVTGTAGEALGITLASNGAADDLTISVTGANDSSVILASAGTGADAISIQTSAGGVDIDSPAAQDTNIAGGQVALVSKDDAASAISLTANIGTSETIVVTNTQGTSESAVTLVSTAGGVNVDAAAAKDLDLAGGQVKLVSKDNAAGAISLTANIGTSETILVTNTQGTDEASINATSTAGGVNIDAAAAKNVAIDGGQVLIGSKDDAASAIALTANVGTSETIVVTNTQGTAAGAIALTATAGGITATTAAGKAITLAGTTNLLEGADVASPAGGELDLGDGNYFNITGTNNITSIAAADSTSGRMVVLKFADILTFTDGNNLKLAGNLVTSADDTITLFCDGTSWFEMARSVN
jgi:hypothetical protein